MCIHLVGRQRRSNGKTNTDQTEVPDPVDPGKGSQENFLGIGDRIADPFAIQILGRFVPFFLEITLLLSHIDRQMVNIGEPVEHQGLAHTQMIQEATRSFWEAMTSTGLPPLKITLFLAWFENAGSPFPENSPPSGIMEKKRKN